MLLAIVVLIYTISGGLLAVAYTDVIQVAIAFIGSLFLFGFLAMNYGLEIPADMGPMALGQLTDTSQGAAINWATLSALGLGDIVAIDFMARIFASKSPETAQKACFIGCLGTIIIGVPFSLIALSTPKILESQGITLDGSIIPSLLSSGVVPPVLGLSLIHI